MNTRHALRRFLLTVDPAQRANLVVNLLWVAAFATPFLVIGVAISLAQPARAWFGGAAYLLLAGAGFALHAYDAQLRDELRQRWRDAEVEALRRDFAL